MRKCSSEETLNEELKKLDETLADAVRAQFSGSLDRALELVTEDLLRAHATYLASDELQGRNAGHPGNDLATEYIAAQMKRAGLTPAGDKDRDGLPTYYQHFKVFDRQTRNCVGLLEGTDSELKDEIGIATGLY